MMEVSTKRPLPPAQHAQPRRGSGHQDHTTEPEGKIAYDGLLAPVHMASQAALKKALRAYETA
ncbi:hypothetical protein EON64_09235 [archaeon]|nr:MAG: hypothetical protein EON64_09235 [archaeon]